MHTEIDDTEVTLKRNPKTEGLRRATQKANMKCRDDAYSGRWTTQPAHLLGTLPVLTLCRLGNRHLLLHLLPLVSVLISLSRLLASSHSQVISPLLHCCSILLSLGHLCPGRVQSLSSLANL